MISGHVDSYTGPVFVRLGDLRRGADVRVALDGTAVRCRVTPVRRCPQNRSPPRLVYGPAPARELPVITCGGGFDRAAKSYRENVVAFATAVRPRPMLLSWRAS